MTAANPRPLGVLCALLLGCGPAVAVPEGGGSASGTGTTTIIQGSTSLPDPATSEGAATDEGTSSSSGGPACPPLEPAPPGTDALCSADPNAIPPVVASYGDCFDGTVSFRQSWASGGLFLFYDVSASFSTAEVQPVGLTVLDPYDGTLDDCALYYGAPMVPDSKVYQDVGTMTFSFGSNELVGSKSVDDAGRIRYSANAADAGLEPQHLAGHGFRTSGGDAPALDDPAAVTLPEPVILTGTLAEDTPRVFGRDALTISWQPGTADIPLYVSMWTLVDGSDRLSLLCRMEDDGTFTLPAELTCHFPQTDEAFISVMRTDQRLLTTEDGRAIVVDAEAYLVRQVVLE